MNLRTLDASQLNRLLNEWRANRTIESDPNVLHLMLVPERPVLWTWWRLLDKTVSVYERQR